MKPKRMFRSFIKNGKERKDHSILLHIKNGKERKDCSVLLKRMGKKTKNVPFFYKEQARVQERCVLL